MGTKRILITGDMGFIGRHVVQQFDDYVGCDFINDEDVMELTDLSYYDVVIHLAAMASIPRSLKSPRWTYKMNVAATQHLLNLKPKKLVFASSGSVVDPASPYAMSKLICEWLIEQTDTPHCILRLANVYGEGDNKSAIMHFSKTKRAIQINGDGSQVRNFVHVKDVARAFKLAVDLEGKYVVAHETYTILEVAKMFGKPLRHRDAVPETHTYFIDWDETPPGWKPEIKIEEWIDETQY